ncbi:MAG: GNAT family N-acetyltransferase [Oscillospiraceae bacterium]
MIFRLASQADIPRIMQIIDSAKLFFRESGIPQWQDGYPDSTSLREDILSGCSYVLCENGAVAATAAILFGKDRNYDNIYDGNWTAGGEYAVIHRIAVDSNQKKRGLASEIIQNAVRLARERGLESIRVDTHEKNLPMRAMLEKNGFVYCGRVLLSDADNAPRIAFELRV